MCITYSAFSLILINVEFKKKKMSTDLYSFLRTSNFLKNNSQPFSNKHDYTTTTKSEKIAEYCMWLIIFKKLHKKNREKKSKY